MQYNLNNLWEMLETYKVDSSENAKKIFCCAEKKRTAFLQLLNNEQSHLFFEYQESISTLIETERKEAFIQGIKFATQFLLEATDK